MDRGVLETLGTTLLMSHIGGGVVHCLMSPKGGCGEGTQEGNKLEARVQERTAK